MVLLAIHIYNSAKKTEKNIASAIRRKKNNPYIYGTKAHLYIYSKKSCAEGLWNIEWYMQNKSKRYGKNSKS